MTRWTVRHAVHEAEARNSFPECILGQSIEADHCFLVRPEDFAAACRNGVGHLPRVSHFEKHQVTPFSSMGKNHDSGIAFLETLEEIPEFDRLCHSGALKSVALHAGHLAFAPFKTTSCQLGSLCLGASQAYRGQVSLFPECLNFRRRGAERIYLLLSRKRKLCFRICS